VNVIVTPNSEENRAVTWSSSNPAVATVSEIGEVEFISGGLSVTITARSKVDSTKFGTVTFVVGVVHPSEVRISGTGVTGASGIYTATVSLDETGTASISLTAAVIPSGADQAVFWEIISGEEVILSSPTDKTIDVGFFTNGPVEITVKSSDSSRSATITISVVLPG